MKCTHTHTVRRSEHTADTAGTVATRHTTYSCVVQTTATCRVPTTPMLTHIPPEARRWNISLHEFWNSSIHVGDEDSCITFVRHTYVTCILFGVRCLSVHMRADRLFLRAARTFAMHSKIKLHTFVCVVCALARRAHAIWAFRAFSCAYELECEQVDSIKWNRMTYWHRKLYNGMHEIIFDRQSLAITIPTIFFLLSRSLSHGTFYCQQMVRWRHSISCRQPTSAQQSER